MPLHQPQKRNKLKVILSLLVALILLYGFIYSQDPPKLHAKEEISVVIAYQAIIDPSKIAQANHAYEAAIGKQIIWKKFDSGADVLAALAAGEVDIANMGSAPFTIAASLGLPTEVFYISGIPDTAEALIVRNDRAPLDGLAGKKIAVPFTSTAHYSLLATLEHLKINEKLVQLVNLRPSEIVAAWERGDIDAAYVWEPALSQLKVNGQIQISGRDVRKWGKPTYDLWVADSNFAAQYPEVLAQFVAVTDREVRWYEQNKNNIANFSDVINKIAQMTGSRSEDVATIMAGNDYPALKEQKHILTKTLADDLRNTAIFLQQQGKINSVKDSYAENINTKAVTSVVGKL